MLKRGKFRYAVDNFMSKGGLSVFFALMSLFVLAIVVLTGLRFVANLVLPDSKEAEISDLATQSWLTFMQVADGGAIAEDTTHNWLNRLVGIIALFIGLVLFSSLIAFITSQFEARLESLKKGKSKVLEKGHTIILGFNERSVEIILELATAKESEKRPRVIVLAEREKDEMDDYFREKLSGLKKLKVITRSGSTTNINSLQSLSIRDARSVIILNDAEATDPADLIQEGDLRVIKSLMAIESLTKGSLSSVVAEIHQPSKRELARSNFPQTAIINEEDVLSKLIVQTSRISGLAQVYDMLVGFKGSEFYITPTKAHLIGKTFSELALMTPNCSLIGITDSHGKVKINPPTNHVMAQGENLILLAQDDSLISFDTQLKTSLSVEKLVSIKHEKKIEHQLIVGWNEKAPKIFEEYSQYLIAGSKLFIVCKEPHDELEKRIEILKQKYEGLSIQIIPKDIHEKGVIESLKPEDFDNVIILSESHENPELSDAETITTLLEFRYYFKHLPNGHNKTQLITEVASSENTQLIEDAGVRDFLISNKFVSRIYAQVSEDPKTLEIYDDLFRAEGSELYIKPISYFTTRLGEAISYRDLCAYALSRGEVLIGVRDSSAMDDREMDYGFIINPPKNRQFNLGAEDFLVTIAEDET